MQELSGQGTLGRDTAAQNLVGREIEIAAITHALSAAQEGKPCCIMLSGPAGIGKSSLVRELAVMVHGAGLKVGIGRGHEGLQIPYLPLRDALRPLDGFGAGSPLLDLLDKDSAPLATGEAAEPSNEPSGTWSETLDRAHGAEDLYRNLLTLLIDRLDQGMLVLVIEDLHWIDGATLDLLNYLLAALNDLAPSRPLPLLVVMTHRDPAEGAAGRFISRVSRYAMVERMTLPPFGDAQTRTFMQNLGVQRPAQALIGAVQAATKGNPLFIQSVVADLRSSGALASVGGHTVALTASETFRLPDDLQDAIAQNLDRLDAATIELLRTAALLGGPFAVADLSAIHGEPGNAVERRLEEAESLLVETEDGFVFAHPAVQQAVSSRIRPSLRRRTHAKIAAHLDSEQAALRGVRPETSRWQLAHHYIQAGPEADRKRTFFLCREAASDAANVFAWDQAATAWMGAAGSAPDDQQRADMNLQAALCYHNAWDWGPCVAQFDNALTLYRDLRDDIGVARVIANRARSRLPAKVYGEAFETAPLDQAILALGDREPALRGLLHSRIADAHWNARDWEQCRISAERAIKLARETDDERLASVASVPLALSYYQTVRLKEACAVFRDSIRHAERSGLPWLENVPRQRLVHTLQLRNKLSQAAGEHEIGLAAALRTGDVGETSFALANAATLAAIEGKLDQVGDIVREALNAVERSRYPFSGLFAIMTLSYSRLLAGSWNDAKDALLQIETPGAIFEEPGRAIVGLARAIHDFIDGTAAADAESQDDRTKRRDRMVRQAKAIQHLGLDVTALGMACILVEHGVETQAHEAVEVLLPLLIQAYESGYILAPGWPLLLPRIIALGRGLMGETEAAEQLLRQTIELARASGARTELARARLDLAHFLAGDRSPKARAEARLLLDLAYADFLSIGMRPSARRAEALAHGLGLRLGGAEQKNLVDEADVALLHGISAGRDKSALEAELLLSSDSVDRRLAELGVRLDTDSTAETLAEAIDRRIVSVPAMPRVPATFLVTDIVGFTPLLEQLGDERAQILVQAHNRLLRAAGRDHQGREISYTGDGFILSFSAAVEAITCAIAIQQALTTFNSRQAQHHDHPPIVLRVGLDAGEPLLDDERLFGRALVSAVRVCGQAAGGEILISSAVRDLVPEIPEQLIDRGMHALKGFAKAAHLYEVQWQAPAG